GFLKPCGKFTKPMDWSKSLRKSRKRKNNHHRSTEKNSQRRFVPRGFDADMLPFQASGADYAGQMLNAVFPNICSCISLLRGRAQKSSRFCFMSFTPGPGQSVPNRVL